MRGFGLVQEASEDLVAMLYAALLGEIDWQAFVDRTAQLANVDFATLFFHDAQSGLGAITLQTGIPEQAQRDYLSHYSRLNPWMWQIGRTPIGSAIHGDHLVARDRFERTEYYNDFLRSYGIESGLGVTIQRSEGRFLLLSTLSSDASEAHNSVREGILNRLAPHVGRAAEFYRRHQLGGLGNDLSTHLSERAGLSVILVDAIGKVFFTNPKAEADLEVGTLAYLRPGRLLQFREQELQIALHQLLSADASAGLVSVRRAGRLVSLVPLGKANASRYFDGRAVAVVLAPQSGDPVALAKRFGLTMAEYRVLAAVLDGKRPAQIAQAAGLSTETIRSQLKAVFSKTGAQGQADLVRIAAGLAEDQVGHS